MKLQSNMLLASNWNKYMIVVDREESFDLVKDHLIHNYDHFSDENEEYRSRLAEKVNEVLDEIDDFSFSIESGNVYWSMEDLIGMEGGWMYDDLVSNPHWDGKEIEVMWKFLEKDDHEECDFIIGMGEEQPELYDSYEDIFKQLVDMNVIPKNS